LDTREKILTSGATVVTGYFDPLTAAHTRRLSELKEIGKPLVVVVTSPPSPILPVRARAELVAALGAVDHVIIADDVAHEEEADLARTAALIAHVRTRQ
jgi:glycerol-3-phosphate cytidylyltransferase-like family protein